MRERTAVMDSPKTKIKLCGLSRVEDIEAANRLKPDYIGFVFFKGSRRQVTDRQAAELRLKLSPMILKVGVFVREDPEHVAKLLGEGIIDLAQLHGGEDADYIRTLRSMTDSPIIQAFRIDGIGDLRAAEESGADYILLDSGRGSGATFEWDLLRGFDRPYFLAGGLSPANVTAALRTLAPFAVDVSSGIETGGVKDAEKMEEFVRLVRQA